MHVLEFIHLHGNITKVTKQGLEKLYDLTTKHYLHSTNHRETEALLQLMEKRNQFEDLEIEISAESSYVYLPQLWTSWS